MDLSNLQNIIQENQEHELAEEASKKQDLNYLDLRETIIKVTQALIEFQESHTITAIVANQPKSISTPDVEATTRAVQGLHETISKQEPVDIQPLVEKMSDAISELKSLPKQYPELKLPDRIDYTKNISELHTLLSEVVSSIEKLELKPADVNVEAPEINVEAPDFKPLIVESKKLEKAIKAIKIPKPDKTDLSKVEKELKAHTKLLKDIREVSSSGSGGGGGIPLVDGGVPTVSGLVPKTYDTIQITSYNTNDDPLVVVYRSGGASGTTVATLTLTYSGTNVTQVVRT